MVEPESLGPMDNPSRPSSPSPSSRFKDLLEELKRRTFQSKEYGDQALQQLYWTNLVVARQALMTDIVRATDTDIPGQYSAEHRDIQPDLSRYSKLSIRHF